ncbi:MAG: TetR/AcrR family transcriptional regulator [Pseudomonadales bacterium]|nr:TetR/AcrR family transcriptional regulator [Pseudomonadales bacterium]
MKKSDIKQRRKPKQSRSIAKYNQILDASARVLQRFGYDKATVSEISLESGQPYATIYQYFGGKEDIYTAWLDRFSEQALQELTGLIENTANKKVSLHIETAARYSLEQIVANKATLECLLGGMPLVITELVQSMEQNTMNLIRRFYGDDLNDSLSGSSSAVIENIHTAVRAGNGYWLQVALLKNDNFDIEKETQKFASLVKTLVFIK